MKHIVITGGTRGIGHGLADAFLARGCAVTLTGRSAESTQSAAAKLSERHDPARIHGQPCDVRDPGQVQALWDAAHARWGQVDIWINNAGISHPHLPFWEQTPDTLRAVVGTNLLGAMYGSRVALRGMIAQGHGALYNMEGMGSEGRLAPGMAPYGCTKRAIRYLIRALVAEAKSTPVLVGALSPGMVLTDLLLGESGASPEALERFRRIYNILADRVETVTPWLADRILANTKQGARIAWLTQGKAMGRFMLAPFRKRDLFSG